MPYNYKKTITCKNCKEEKLIWRKANSGFCSYKCYAEHNKDTFLEDWLAGKINGVYNTSYSLHKRVKRYFRDNFFICQICNQSNEWNGKKLNFEIDHINGDRKNNYLNNLRYICPNCHSQTETFRSKNIKKTVL